MNENAVAVIIANGEFTPAENIRNLIDSAHLIVAADGGLEHILRLGYVPHVLIGDMDSVQDDDLVQMKAKGVEVIIHPIEKDETDLELALQAVLQREYQHIRILAALGGRLDQTLANISLLMQRQLDGCDVRLVDASQEVFVIRRKAFVEGKAGDIVSLIPLGDAVEGIQTEGLKYRLQGETLFPQHTRGISNRMTASRAAIQIQEGTLLCIHMFTR